MATQEELEQRLDDVAQKVASALKKQDRKIVFAESCTGGKMASAMTTVPGISGHFCGSAVTYREATKTQWLSISPSDLEKHSAESEFTTVEMAKSVLKKTPEADCAIAITGHLGPGIDKAIDGRIFIVAATRNGQTADLKSTEARLQSSTRKQRQAEAACIALEVFLEAKV